MANPHRTTRPALAVAALLLLGAAGAAQAHDYRRADAPRAAPWAARHHDDRDHDYYRIHDHYRDPDYYRGYEQPRRWRRGERDERGFGHLRRGDDDHGRRDWRSDRDRHRR